MYLVVYNPEGCSDYSFLGLYEDERKMRSRVTQLLADGEYIEDEIVVYKLKVGDMDVADWEYYEL